HRRAGACLPRPRRTTARPGRRRDTDPRRPAPGRGRPRTRPGWRACATGLPGPVQRRSVGIRPDGRWTPRPARRAPRRPAGRAPADTIGNVRRPMGVAVVFPGQGSQFPEMLDPWLGHPASAAVVTEASEVLGFDLAARCHEPGALERTDITQLAVFTADVAAFRVLETAGLMPVAAAGHSLGEFAALVAT